MWKVSWTQHKRNTEVLKRMKKDEEVIDTAKKRKRAIPSLELEIKIRADAAGVRRKD